MRCFLVCLLTAAEQNYFFVKKPGQGFLTEWAARRRVSNIVSRFISTSAADKPTSFRSSTSTVGTSSSNALSDRLRHAFRENHTDGVRKLMAGILLSGSPPSPSNVVLSCYEAALGSHKGHAASLINSCIGACAQTEDAALGAEMAQGILRALEASEKEQDDQYIKPDVLTWALLYAAVERHDPLQAEAVLEKGLRQSKKLAGSSRRKALATARRKPMRKASDCVQELQALLGPDFAVLSETDQYVVVHKPSGVVCHHAHTTTAGKVGRRNADVSLVDAMLHVNVPLSTLNPQAQGVVHRLDRGTSGCTLLAKTDRMHALLVTAFFLRQAHKVYHTIVSPVPSMTATAAAEKGDLDVPVDGRPARSRFTVVKRRSTDLALLRMEIFTGRKHQVRVHAALGLQAPVLLDSVYGKGAIVPEDVHPLLDNASNEDGRERFFLHAASLDIPHLTISASASEPAFWHPILDLFD